MPTTEQKHAVVCAHVAVFEAGSADVAAALFADNATVEDPVGTPIKNDNDKIIEMRAFWGAENMKAA
jgi:steroid Delta-isomerase